MPAQRLLLLLVLTPKNSAPLKPVKEREASISPDSGRRSTLKGRDRALSVNQANIRRV